MVRRAQRLQERSRLGALFGLHNTSAVANIARVDEARSATQAGLTLDPSFTIRRFRASAASDNPTYLTQRERIYEGMRKAGLPEG